MAAHRDLMNATRPARWDSAYRTPTDAPAAPDPLS